MLQMAVRQQTEQPPAWNIWSPDVFVQTVSIPCSAACFTWQLNSVVDSYARFKRRILYAPNRIPELGTCKMQRLNQLKVKCNEIRPGLILTQNKTL